MKQCHQLHLCSPSLDFDCFTQLFEQTQKNRASLQLGWALWLFYFSLQVNIQPLQICLVIFPDHCFHKQNVHWLLKGED